MRGHWIGVFLCFAAWLGLGSPDAAAPRCPGAGSDPPPFPSLLQPLVRRVRRSPDGLIPLYRFGRSFLQVVQPNPFPQDIVSKALRNEHQDMAKLVQYQAGYLVCLILAVLYLLLMPTVGGVLAWRHFHSGGRFRLYNHLSGWRHHRDVAAAGCIILVTLLLLIGVILAFSTNDRTRDNMHPALQQLDANMGAIEDGLRSIPQKMESITELYKIPKSELSKTINEADDVIGSAIIASLSDDFRKALANLSSAVEETGNGDAYVTELAARAEELAADASGSIDNLQIMETMRLSLSSRQQTLEKGLQELEGRLKNLEKCPGCGIPDSSDLETDADYTEIPSVQDKLDAMPPKSIFSVLVEQSNRTFHGIPQFCSEQIAPSTSAFLSGLQKTQRSLANASRTFPSLHTFREAVTKLRTGVQSFKGPVDRYDYVRWAVAITLCTALLLIVLMMATAVSIGLPALFNPVVYRCFPDTRLERTALCLFQLSMLLSCVFSWLLITLVFVALFFGGNAHTLGCRSFTRGRIFTFLDRQEDLFTSFNGSPGNQTTQIHPKTATVYLGCVRGQSMFCSMEMNQIFDLEDFLNATKYLEALSKAAQKMTVDVTDLKLLSDGGERSLQKFGALNLESYQYDEVIRLLNKTVVERDLAALADELEKEAELSDNAGIKAILQQEAANARRLHNIVGQQMTDAVKMSGRVSALRSLSLTYKTYVDNALSGFNRTEETLRVQVPRITDKVSQCILEQAEQGLLRYLGWVRHTILDEVMGCHWVARSVENMYTAVCLNVIDPWNAFWLSLGWCCAFLVPGVFLSLYVAERLQSHPAAPPSIEKDRTILPDIQPRKEWNVERKITINVAEESLKSKSNTYMTLEELCGATIEDVKMEGKVYEET